MYLLTKLIILVHSWYPSNCCSDKDCKPIPCDQVEAVVNGGYTWKGYFFQTMQPSMDNLCHACINSIGKGVCLFLQAGV